MRYLPIAVVALLVLVATLFTQPQTFWQGEEVRFAQSLLTFDPVQQQPQAPGYPLFVAIASLLNFFLRQPFRTLVTLSAIASVAGAILTGLAAARILENVWLGAAAALFLFGSPAMLVFAPLPNAEATGVALIAAGILFGGAFAAAAIGVLPQAVGMTLFGVRRFAATFAIAIALIFIPFFASVPKSYLAIAPKTPAPQLLLRYAAHGWGMKWLAMPLLAIAAIGAILSIRRVWTLVAFAAIQIGVCLFFADRLAGVEPAIPAMIAIAICASAAFSRWPRAALAVAFVYAVASFAYVWPVLQQRRTTLSPPASAMRFARQTLPGDAILVCDGAMEPWGRLTRFEFASAADFDRYADRRDVQLYLAADGASEAPNARVFTWPASDAYEKISGERYRSVSIVPLPPNVRYRALSGVYAFERLAGGGGGRWLAGDATIALPDVAARVVHVRVALPADAPIESNTIALNRTTVTVVRGLSADVAFPSAQLLRIHAERTYQRDGRNLAVQLLALEQR